MWVQEIRKTSSGNTTLTSCPKMRLKYQLGTRQLPKCLTQEANLLYNSNLLKTSCTPACQVIPRPPANSLLYTLYSHYPKAYSLFYPLTAHILQPTTSSTPLQPISYSQQPTLPPYSAALGPRPAPWLLQWTLHCSSVTYTTVRCLAQSVYFHREYPWRGRQGQSQSGAEEGEVRRCRVQ